MPAERSLTSSSTMARAAATANADSHASPVTPQFTSSQGPLKPATVPPIKDAAAPSVIALPRCEGVCSLNSGKWLTMLNSKHMRASAMAATTGTTPKLKKGISR